MLIERRVCRKHIGGLRPLQHAAINGHISIVKELIEVRNADINARNGSGETALMAAREENQTQIASYLVSLGGII
jgi:ankyrin repeat protein